MKIKPRAFLAIAGIIFTFSFCFAQNAPEPAVKQEVKQEPAKEAAGENSEKQTAVVDDLTKSGYVTLDFKEADIRNVLKIISYKAGVNIVYTPEVIGNITIRLVDVPWEKALDVIVRTNGFGYDRIGNIITVAPIEKLTSLKKQELELAQVQPTITEVFDLKYIDAQDAKKAIEPQLSPRGKITILEMTGQAGWEFGGETLGKRKRVTEEKMNRSKILIISDIAPAIDKIKAVVEQIDVLPRQVLIETRIMEVSRDRLKDIGFDYGTGLNGATSTPITVSGLGKVGGHSLVSQVTPSGFVPKATGILGSSTTATPFNTGLEVLFQKFTGTQFEIMLHALEEDVHTNVLSSPRIMALNNQEATILVGTRYPILKQDTTSSSSSATVTTVSLDYYQDIGIQLNVVPQIGADNYINMVVHPAVTSFTDKLGGTANIAQYPIIETREAETRIFMKDGETVVIGGLLKDIKSKGKQGIPFLSNIPVLGVLFSRDTYDTGKLDLLIFITARIVKEGEFSAEELANLEHNLQTISEKPKKPKK
jgi:type IV pilus assembly protein PilQ